MELLTGTTTAEKTGIFAAIFTLLGTLIVGVLSFFRWIIGIAGEHKQLMEHMQATQDYPITHQQVQTLKEEHVGLLSEVKGLRQDLQDLFKLLIEAKHGS